MADEENDPIIIETVKCPDDSVIPYKANIATPTNLEQLRFHYQQELKAIERSFQSLIDSLECVEWEIPNYTLEDEDVTEGNDCFDICCYIFEEPGDGTGGTPCKEYECDSYSAWAGSGDGTYYWPCQNDVSDGYLEGTINVPIVGPYQNISSSILPDACANWESWKANQGAAMEPVVTIEASHAATTLYLYGGGTSDSNIFFAELFWTNPLYPSDFAKCTVQLVVDPVDINNRQLVAVGNMAGSGGRFATGNFDNASPHAIGYSLEVPETVTDGEAFSGSISALIDGVVVQTTVIDGTISSNAPAGTVFTYDPDFASAVYRMFNSSCEGYFSDIAIQGGSQFDVDEWKQAWDQNQSDYVDPNPNCGQSTGAVQVAVVPEEGQILAWSEKHQCYLPIDNCCPPICTHETITYPPLTPCKEYSCDSYHIYLDGSAQYYWPADNPVSDGYLAGTVNLPATGNYTNSDPLFPDGCVTQSGWISAEGAYLDGSEIHPVIGAMGPYNFSVLYDAGGGTSDASVFLHTLSWVTTDNYWACAEVNFIPFVNGNLNVRIDTPSGQDSVPLSLTVSDAIPSDGLPHVISFTVDLPGDTAVSPPGPADPNHLLPIDITVYVDWVEVGSGTAQLSLYIPDRVWTFDPDYPGYGRLEFEKGSTNNYFANMAINGGADVDIEALRDAYLRNFTDYVDPDPTCGETLPPVTIPIEPQDGDILVYDKENECLKYTGIDLDVDDVIDDARTALDTTWSSSKIQQQLDGKKDDGESVRWRYDGWQTGEVYYRMDMTYDGPWLGVARRETTDRLSPQAIGDPFYLYDPDNTTTEQVVAKQVLFGQRYSVSTGGWVNGYRVYTVVGNNYTVYSVVDPTTAPKINTLVSFEASTTGWQVFALSPLVIGAGDKFDLLVQVSEPDPTPIVIQGNWNYLKPQNPAIPGDGEAIHSGREPDTIDISVIDDDGADRGAELRGLTVGDLMYMTDGIQWAIQLVTDNITYMTLVVAPAVQSTLGGVQEFNFETVSPTPVSYQRELDKWLGFAEVQGLYGADTDYSSIIPDTNQYGADLLLQEGEVSPDWDIYGSTNTATTASSGKSLQDEQDFFDLLSQTGSGGVSQRVDRVEDMLHKLVGALRDLRDE